MEDKNINSGLIDRFFRDECSDEEKTYLFKVFCDNNKEEDLTRLLKKQWHELIQKDESSDKNLEHILYKIHYELNIKESISKNILSFGNIFKWFSRIAAILILPLAIYSGIHFLEASANEKISWVEVNAPSWTRVQFSLPDGTTGWLNSNSSLKYYGNFIKDRQVTLKGEAFFDVYKDKNRLFKVNTDEIVVSVLGTRFNIASYENEKDVEIVLEEGKLIFNDKEMNGGCLLYPNDLIVYNKSLKDFSIEKVQTNKYLSWTQGKLVFRNDPLDVIARRLERWYNVNVEIVGDISQDLRLRATFLDESLEEVLYMLKRSLPINYRIEDSGLRPDETYAKKKVIISSGTDDLNIN